MRRRWTDSDLVEAVRKNETVAAVLRQLGLRPMGGNYQTIRDAVKRLRLDTAHFKGLGWSRGKRFDSRPQSSLKELLRKGRRYNSARLRERLIRDKILDAVCSTCGRKVWLGKAIPLELDHINGDSLDNRLENLRLVCPNCHALTPNYRGKGIKSARRTENPKCRRCGKSVSERKNRCRSCAQKERTKGRKRKVVRPPASEIQVEVSAMGFEATGRKHGVTGNAVRKWLR